MNLRRLIRIGGRNILISFAVLIILTLLIPTVTAHHLLPGQECGYYYESPCPKGCYCGPIDAACHYERYCPTSPRLPDVPKALDPDLKDKLTDSVVKAGQSLAEVDALRKKTGRLNEQEAKFIVEQERELAYYYDQILKADPDNFWANYDYASLKKNQENYFGADRLYYNAISTLNQEARVELATSLRIETVGKLKLTRTPKPEKSTSFLATMGDDIKEAFNIRNDPNNNFETEKLTWRVKLTKRIDFIPQSNIYTQCVSGKRSLSGCVLGLGPKGGGS